MTYASEVAALSPVLNWRLGESSGTTAVDDSGYGNDGTHQGTVTLGTAGILGGGGDTALTISNTDGSSVMASWSSDFAIGSATTLSLAFWYKGTDTTAGLNRGYFHAYTNGSNRQWGLSVATGGAVRAFAGDSTTGTQLLTSTTSVADGAWHMVCLTIVRDTGTATYRRTLYIDGLQEHQRTTSFPAGVGSPTVYLGRAAYSGSFATEGVYDEVAIFPSELSAAQVLSLYELGSTVPAVSQSGATSLIHAVSGEGEASLQGAGTLASTHDVAVTGSSSRSGEGGGSNLHSIVGIISEYGYGAGSEALVAVAGGTGTASFSGEVNLSDLVSITGEGERSTSGDGSTVLLSSAVASGSTSTTGDGSLAAVHGVTAVGGRLVSGAGSMEATQTLHGTGGKGVALAGADALVASIVGSGLSVLFRSLVQTIGSLERVQTTGVTGEQLIGSIERIQQIGPIERSQSIGSYDRVQLLGVEESITTSAETQ